MPSSQKKPKGSHAPSRGSSKPITDPRFSNIQTDPRYRLPSRKQNRVQLDNRFSRMLKDEDFYQKASVDRYGRRLPKDTGKEALQRFYRIEKNRDGGDISSDDEPDADDDVKNELARVERKYDPAREGGFSEDSSSSESEDEEEDILADDETAGGADDVQEAIPEGEVSSRLAVVNLDWDNIRAVDIMAVAASFCPPDGRIVHVAIYPSEFGKERMEREEVEGPPKELFTSVKSNHNQGQRHDRSTERNHSDNDDSEEDDFDDEKIKKYLIKEADSTDFDSHALRSYQLSRLRYYYAIITTSSDATALAIYNAMDGREYLSTANFFDLRFVPQDTTFPDSNDPAVAKTDRARDECERVPEGYKANEFTTDSLTHSKVRLTWDEDDRSRKEAQKRAFSRREIDENDLKAYIGSDSSEDDEDATAKPHLDSQNTLNDEPEHVTPAEVARQKMRLALGLPAEAEPSHKDRRKMKGEKGSRDAAPVGDMQITFSAALTSDPATKTSVFANTPADVHEETTKERYIPMEKERKMRRRAKAKAAREGKNADGEEDDNDSDADPNRKSTMTKPSDSKSDLTAADSEDPFADPFFEDPAAANKALQKEAKRARREKAAELAKATEERKSRERKELELLMMDDQVVERKDGVEHGPEDNAIISAKGKLSKAQHFDMRVIKKAEKEAARDKKSRKKAKKNKKGQFSDNAEEAVDDFELPLTDPRFAALYSSHEYAIDPSNPRFSGTKSMKAILDEGRQRRSKHGGDQAESLAKEANLTKRKRENVAGIDAEDLEDLVKRVKRHEQI